MTCIFTTIAYIVLLQKVSVVVKKIYEHGPETRDKLHRNSTLFRSHVRISANRLVLIAGTSSLLMS